MSAHEVIEYLETIAIELQGSSYSEDEVCEKVKELIGCSKATARELTCKGIEAGILVSTVNWEGFVLEVNKEYEAIILDMRYFLDVFIDIQYEYE